MNDFRSYSALSVSRCRHGAQLKVQLPGLGYISSLGQAGVATKLFREPPVSKYNE